MSKSNRQTSIPTCFRLFVERLSDAAELPVAADVADEVIVIGQRVNYLSLDAEDPNRLNGSPSAAAGADWLLAPVWNTARQPKLLLVSPQQQRARVNGQIAPRVTLLGIKDQLQLRPEYLLHVSLYRQQMVGNPPPEVIGSECPLCRVRLTADRVIYCCPLCRTALHCEEEGSRDDALGCAYLGSECPSCGEPIELSDGYAYVPEL